MNKLTSTKKLFLLSFTLIVISFQNNIIAQQANLPALSDEVTTSCTDTLNYKAYSIVTCPGEDTRTQMNISWAVDANIAKSYLLYTTIKDKMWKKAIVAIPEKDYCDLFNNIYSKRANGENYYETAKFIKCNVVLKKLKKKTKYMYKVITESCNSSATAVNSSATSTKSAIATTQSKQISDIHYFITSGSNKWSACIISDFHNYPPLPKRTEAAMSMIKKITEYDNNVSWILHLGDICAWGGSYSFWKDLYTNDYFKKYMWAGVNGNHDNMSRKYELTNNYFRYANFYPLNGYDGEKGVCYYFNYSGTLFIMLNSESMRTDTGLAKAQEWVKEVIANNQAEYIVVCEHYQWFFGADGESSQYERWRKVFDECGVDLALAGNNHIYVRTNAIYNGKEVIDSLECKSKKSLRNGTVYIQTPSSDNERGVSCNTPLTHNKELIKTRWTEGPNTVGAIHISVSPKRIKLALLNRNGDIIDIKSIYRKTLIHR